MRRKSTSVGLWSALAGFTVLLLMPGIPALGQETGIWPARQAMSAPVPDKDTSIPEASRERSIPASSKDAGIPATGQGTGVRPLRHGMPRHGRTIRPADGDEDVLWDFGSYDTDGQGPQAGVVIDSAGNLYGTTVSGGAYSQGMVFELKPTEDGYEEYDLHDFGAPGAHDGIQPQGGLIIFQGSLWGTTNGGGEYNYGTVFQLVPDGSGGWTENIQHSFEGDDEDGANPTPAVLCPSPTGSVLYGMTYKGGEYGEGTVFKLYMVDGFWFEGVQYSFGPDEGDQPAYPESGLITDSAGNLYGTTSEGGPYDGGVVFEMFPDFSARIVLDFLDGSTPMGNLLLVNDNIYGVTERSGAHHSGTVFEISRPGSYNHLYSFGSRGDGINPQAGLLYGNNGYLYGTASGGGMYGFGTVFSESLGGGADLTLWSFGSGDDGSFPTSNLILGPDGTLYGTTVFGGLYGHGTVFSIGP